MNEQNRIAAVIAQFNAQSYHQRATDPHRHHQGHVVDLRTYLTNMQERRAHYAQRARVAMGIES